MWGTWNGNAYTANSFLNNWYQIGQFCGETGIAGVYLDNEGGAMGPNANCFLNWWPVNNPNGYGGGYGTDGGQHYLLHVGGLLRAGGGLVPDRGGQPHNRG